MAISEVETSTPTVLLKESDIPEASLAGRKPAEFEIVIFCFGSD